MKEHVYHSLLTYRRKDINEDLNGREAYQYPKPLQQWLERLVGMKI